ncbi:unnamed protein product [Ceratitis capitata]|uniref:(Mediterranean fruit fly) hypothetical protein n=1 Tax=Ceratitis capitata TaxID=7213 RepID=A0A811UAS4_CERCA|nr:unnamed protein product [Ceratitis capitata]
MSIYKSKQMLYFKRCNQYEDYPHVLQAKSRSKDPPYSEPHAMNPLTTFRLPSIHRRIVYLSMCNVQK